MNGMRRTGQVDGRLPGFRVLRRAVAVAGLGVLGWGVAPAISLDPYVPRAVDFERSLPEAKRVTPPARSAGAPRQAGVGVRGRHLDEGPVRYITPVVEAPARFDLVGVAGEMRSLEFRVREDGDEWSEWVETSNGEPVYTGGADAVQVRGRRTRPEGKLHFVNVSGDHSTASGALNAVRRAVNSAIVAVASLPTAAAQAPELGAVLEVVTRKQWGAERKSGGCKPRTKPEYGKVQAAVVHHTVTTSSYTRQEAAGIVLAICRYHRNANGWNDIGYNALIDRFGRVYEGRDGGLGRRLVGAHAQGFNSSVTGVASIATHTKRGPTRKAKKALVHFLAWKLAKHGIPAKGRTGIVSGGGALNRHPAGRRVRLKRILSHSDTGFTECAGRGMRRQLKGIRKRTQQRIDRLAETIVLPPPGVEPPAEEQQRGG